MNGKNEKILQAFLGGKARSRVVKLFLYYPRLTLNIADISKKTGVKFTECAKIIKELVSLGFLAAVKQSNVVKRRK